ncbi:MAG: ABC transporter ATP-binding protein [Deltaproteobacteria bacterium]|nr:ABC transporter ATP-binding protein [Deltaproteobacteria bacterium]
MPLLAVDNLSTHFRTDAGVVRAADEVSFSIAAGETIGLVGESGCGKSVTALSLIRLITSPPGRIVGGRVLFARNGHAVDLARVDGRTLRAVRGAEIAMIFQEPMTALNPVMRIGAQIAENLLAHRRADRRQARGQAIQLLRRVGIPEPETRIDHYPHELSGGMRQRVMIAMAIACRPKLLIADEPTTALDVTIQAQILSLLADLQRQEGMAILLITHDLGIVAHMASRVAVMYAGRIVETAAVRALFAHPRHPYTAGLLQAIPPLAKRPGNARLATIPGVVPHLARLPVGCPFQDRCPRVQPRCRETMPELETKAPEHWARCFYPL